MLWELGVGEAEQERAFDRAKGSKLYILVVHWCLLRWLLARHDVVPASTNGKVPDAFRKSGQLEVSLELGQ